MIVSFNGSEFPIRAWQPANGPCAGRIVAIDTETTRISSDFPWLSPTYVLGAAFDGTDVFIITKDHLPAFLAAHRGHELIMHHAAFDLAVLDTAAPGSGAYDQVNDHLVWDTEILHRLLTLAVDGHTASGKGESTLDTCVKKYLGIDLDKNVVDSKGDPVRLSYQKWLNRPPGEIEPVYLRYLAEDVIATFSLHQELRTRIDRLLRTSQSAWGYVNADWLQDCVRRFGPLTHHVQLKALIVLRAITDNGIRLDTNKQAELTARLQDKLKTQRAALLEAGYMPGEKGNQKALQDFLKRIERDNPSLSFPRTGAGMISTKRDDLKEAADLHPFVRQLLEFRESEKLLKAFVGKLAKPVVHPSFDVLARTGRTTSFGDINAQNLPRESAVRDCIIPHPGNVFIDADYETVEMATLSQVCIGQFGYESKMAAAINADLDLHRLVAAKMLGKHVDDVTDDERQKAKAVNFGKPGGMTDATLTRYAAVNYRVNLTAEETAELSRSWFELFPEMHQFLEKENVVPQRLAELLALTPASYRQATGEDRFGFLSDQVDAPLDTLGMMLIKAVGHRDPTTDRGRRYSAEEISYFFGHVETVIDRLPAKLQKSVRAREPSKRLQGAVMSLADRAAVFTLTGRLRANASYTARHNTVFQGLAADGAKLALWRIWRAGYRIANFIHDQVLVEVPRGSDLKHHADTVRQLMVDGMREVVPDVKISVAYAASERWFKGAKAVFDETGSLLLPWSPPQTTSNGSAEA